MLNTMKYTMIIGLMFIQHCAYSAGTSDAISKIPTQEAYELGQVSMQTKDWYKSIEAFEAAAKDQQLKDAAMYWQAYSYYQVKQNAQARRLLDRLIKNHPNSQWVDDAQVLLFEHGDGGEEISHQDALDEELKLFTLQQIMYNNPEKALPKVYEMLEKSDSERVKQNAIQLLGLSDSEQVVDYLFQFIKKDNNADLQHQAIQMLSMRNSPSSREKLKEIYDNTADRDIKAALIKGYIHHDDNQQLIAMLKQEQDPELSTYLIQMLGIKGESAVLKDMYKDVKGDQKRAILEAVALSGDASFLYQIIDNESDQKIRNQAIHSLILVDEDNLDDYLTKLYQKSTNESEKDVISSVFIATDVSSDVILNLLKTETSQDRKHHLINTLMAMGEVAALKQLYLQETDPNIKSVVIRQFGMMNAADVLFELYEKNPAVADDPAFFQSIGMSSNGSSLLTDEFLMARFKAGDNKLKESVLQVLMMQNNTATMIKLLKTEQDHEVKKQIIKMLGITDPDALIDAIED